MYIYIYIYIYMYIYLYIFIYIYILKIVWVLMLVPVVPHSKLYRKLSENLSTQCPLVTHHLPTLFVSFSKKNIRNWLDMTLPLGTHVEMYLFIAVLEGISPCGL